ncbi:hypothetical protein, partial [Paraburkholderia hospita]|uniref:hypothetical protein n=1 Tax=Paraburkholderia hospita TaxID=169430 RepID=UPI001ABDFC39
MAGRADAAVRQPPALRLIVPPPFIPAFVVVDGAYGRSRRPRETGMRLKNEYRGAARDHMSTEFQAGQVYSK